MSSNKLLLLFFLITLYFFPGHLHADKKPSQVLILYQEELRSEALALSSLIGHFSLTNQLQILRPGEPLALEDSEYVFYLSRPSYDSNLTTRVSEEAKSKGIPLFLIGGGQAERSLPITSVTYDQQTYPLKDHSVYRSGPTDEETVRAFAHDGLNDYPLLYEKQGVWHFQSLQLWGVMGNILADFLHDYFQQPHPHQHQAFIRIEDIHPAAHPENIRKIADLLSGKGIPFMMAVRPVYFNAKDQLTITLDDTPALVEALQYATAKGGSIILHGHSHQNLVTGGGIEFWDQLLDQPIPQEEEYMRSKIEEAIALLVRHDLVPLAFQAPYYALSQEGYRIAENYFSTLVGPIQLSDQTYLAMQRLPYVVQRNSLTVIPETLGYVQNTPIFLEELKDQLQTTLIVRDSLVGVYFHEYLPLEKLSELVLWLEQYPLSYINLADQSNRVETAFVRINSGIEGIKIDIMDPKVLNTMGKKQLQQGFVARNFQYILWGIVLIVLLFSLLFTLNLLRLREKSSTRLFAEREIQG